MLFFQNLEKVNEKLWATEKHQNIYCETTTWVFNVKGLKCNNYPLNFQSLTERLFKVAT